jgi:predicted AAA+ superfamily ATPase
MIDRITARDDVLGLLRRHRIVGLIGARQVGKTTLARQVAGRHRSPITSFDLENPVDLARLEDPMLTLEPLRGLVILDEIQHRPDLFPVLRVLADRNRHGTRFLILGSASPELLRQGAETLAGRIVYRRLGGLTMDEVDPRQRRQLWIRGGFPRSLLARSNQQSLEWRRGFIETFLQRDLSTFGLRLSPVAMRRFWTMLAHYHAQLWNSSELARAFGVAHTTIRGYLDALTETFMVRQLQPFHENLRKRQVKAPKIYISDSGILHALLGLAGREELERHPKVGASWEGFALEAVIGRVAENDADCYFWATHGGAELDLLILKGGRRIGFEFKRASAPRLTPSMRAAMADLGLTELTVVYPGTETYTLAPQIRVAPLETVVGVE